MDKVTKAMSVKSLVRNANKGKVFFNSVVQRQEVWDDYRRSKFIRTLALNRPFLPVFAQELEDGTLTILDGKQRMTTSWRFVNNEFALHKETPDFNGVDVSGLFFKDLPEDIQDAIKDADFLIYVMRDMTDDERDEMFVDWNMGMPLTNIELSKALAGPAMNFLSVVAKSDFFMNVASLSDNARKRSVDVDVLLQIVALLSNGGNGVSFAGPDMKAFAKSLRDGGISEEIQNTMNMAVTYLEAAIPVAEKRMKEMKKVHIPMIFLMAIKAQEMGIPATKFGGWVQMFFARLKANVHQNMIDYGYAAKSKTGHKDSVTKRIDRMTTDFVANINDSPDFKVQIPARTTATSTNAGDMENVTSGTDNPNNDAQIDEQADDQILNAGMDAQTTAGVESEVNA